LGVITIIEGFGACILILARALLLTEKKFTGFFLTSVKGEKCNAEGDGSCVKAALTTKTVQKIKKISFVCNIYVALYVNYEKISSWDWKNARKLPAINT
jgi:hypothetical protein